MLFLEANIRASDPGTAGTSFGVRLSTSNYAEFVSSDRRVVWLVVIQHTGTSAGAKIHFDIGIKRNTGLLTQTRIWL